MKWIGQNIYDFISRFRSDVYLEDIDTGTIASGGNLGLDSNNKIVKAAVADGDITGVTAGTGLSGGGTTGAVTLNVSGLTVSEIAAGSISVAGEPFADNDTSLMSAAAINDRIQSFGYTTNTGDITAVSITTDSGGGDKAEDAGGSAEFSILGATGVGVTNSGTTITAVAVPGEIDHDSLLNFASNEHFTQANITTVGTIGTGTWQGTAITKDYIAADQRNITGVGVIGAGVWQATPVASAYLDADTAHLTTDQTFTGVKTFNEAINKKALHFLYTTNKFTLDTSNELYFSLSDADRDIGTGSEDQVGVMAIVPLTGVLKQFTINTTSTLSTKTWEFRLYRVPSGADADSGGKIKIATVASNAGPASHVNKVISFVTDPGDGTNDITYETGYNATTMFTAGDRILLSLQSNSDAAGNPKINSVLCFELDESTI